MNLLQVGTIAVIEYEIFGLRMHNVDIVRTFYGHSCGLNLIMSGVSEIQGAVFTTRFSGLLRNTFLCSSSYDRAMCTVVLNAEYNMTSCVINIACQWSCIQPTSVLKLK